MRSLKYNEQEAVVGDETAHDWELAEGWTIAELGEVSNARLGKTPKRTDYRDGGSHKIIKFRDLTDRGIDFSATKAGFVFDAPEALNGLRTLLLGDVLVTASAHSGDQIGKKCAYVDHLPNATGDVFFVGELLGITVNHEVLRNKWPFYWFLSDAGKEGIQEAVAGVHLTAGRAQRIPIPIAPTDEQERIIELVDHLFLQINAARNRLAKVSLILKRFRRAVLAAACSGRLTEDWRMQNPRLESAHSLLLRIKEWRLASAQTKQEHDQILVAFEEENLRLADGEAGFEDIPDLWAGCRIGTVGAVCNGSTPSRKRPEFWDGNIRWVSSGEVRNNVISETRERISKAGYENCSVRLLRRGTVLIAMIGEGKTRGQAAVLNVEATINQNIAAVILDHGLVSARYLWYWFQFQYEATRERGSGSGPQALNCQRVRELPFVLPPLEEQQKIVCRVEALFRLADTIENRVGVATKRADKLTQAILAKAFRGELVPTEAELARREARDYEPAAILLERIRAEREEVQTPKPSGRASRRPSRKALAISNAKRGKQTRQA
jgi:type I restriction enzyme, S subunit